MASLGGVRVNVVEARGILAADMGGTSSAYVTITLLDSKGAVMPAGGTFKTNVIKKKLSPQWNEEFIIADKLDLRVVSTLRLLLRDSASGFLGDEVLGVVDIPVSLLIEAQEPLDNWFQLTRYNKMKKDSKGELHLILERLAPQEYMAGRGTGVNIDPELESKLTSVSTEPPNLLYVTLKSGNRLLGMDNNGTTSDPIVFLTFDGQKHESTKKEKTLKPQWNEKFGFYALDVKKNLSILVEDYDVTINDFMGKADVPLKDLKPNIEKSISVDLGNKRGKKDKVERGTLLLSLLWTYDSNAKDIAAKKKKRHFCQALGHQIKTTIQTTMTALRLMTEWQTKKRRKS
ncbi:hypothetical protein CCR75_004089 [Bremia lactucae]|uniref:C2 domain-containing protein n=1 Tax=Bremia lactucae TaxID=4779 RepID=A0A976NZ26_BRELC|nr:hypothetical protein CCR75_004089 [Bremia lactucae]